MSFNEDYKRNEVSLFQLKNILKNFSKTFSRSFISTRNVTTKFINIDCLFRHKKRHNEA